MLEPLVIQDSATPNPNAVKFTLNRVVAAQGKTYRDAAGADAGWAKELLAIPGIVQVFAVNDFVSVTKQPQASWEAIVPQVQQALNRAFA